MRRRDRSASVSLLLLGVWGAEPKDAQRDWLTPNAALRVNSPPIGAVAKLPGVAHECSRHARVGAAGGAGRGSRVRCRMRRRQWPSCTARCNCPASRADCRGPSSCSPASPRRARCREARGAACSGRRGRHPGRTWAGRPPSEVAPTCEGANQRSVSNSLNWLHHHPGAHSPSPYTSPPSGVGYQTPAYW